jgi:hypothetical protein
MLNLAELREYRELLFFFVWRDIKVRYKQTVLGVLWAVIQPLATTFFFALLFGRFGGMSRQVSGPYALHVFVGMMPWTFFSNAVVLAAGSLVGSSHLITKVYRIDWPARAEREACPLSLRAHRSHLRAHRSHTPHGREGKAGAPDGSRTPSASRTTCA